MWKTVASVVLALILYAVYLYIYKHYFYNKDIENISTNTNKINKEFVCGKYPKCPEGCTRPKQIKGNCKAEIMEYEDGTLYKHCPYICSSPFKQCMYDKCCIGCGYEEVEYNPSHI